MIQINLGRLGCRFYEYIFHFRLSDFSNYFNNSIFNYQKYNNFFVVVQSLIKKNSSVVKKMTGLVTNYYKKGLLQSAF